MVIRTTADLVQLTRRRPVDLQSPIKYCPTMLYQLHLRGNREAFDHDLHAALESLYILDIRLRIRSVNSRWSTFRTPCWTTLESRFKLTIDI